MELEFTRQKSRYKDGYLVTLQDGCKLFVYTYEPEANCESTLFLISGISGINHTQETDIIEQLADSKHRVVVIHPRGTGYSEGKRGHLPDFSRFIEDFIEIIESFQKGISGEHSILLYGHSMSCAIVLAIADRLEKIDGVILVNPAYILKKAKGMSPQFQDYLKYAWYFLFARHKPVVNMAGNPALIVNNEDREEAEARRDDPFIVKYFSLYMMMESRKLMNGMLDFARKANIPLLLLYGAKDSIVDKRGCDLLHNAWKHEDKQYHVIGEGAHGKSTIVKGEEVIRNWINSHKRSEVCE